MGENDNQTAFLIFPPPRKTETPPDPNKAVTVVEGKDFIPIEELSRNVPENHFEMSQEEAARFRTVKEESLKSRFMKIFVKGREED